MADQKLNSAFGSIKVRTEDDDPAKKGKSNNAKLPSKGGKGKYKNKFYLVSLKEKQTGSKKGAKST